MNKHKFKVIVGTNDNSEKQRQFISAFITDSRLMGVLGMYIHWKINDADQHQFFYFDVEEYGFDTYKGIFENDEKWLKETKAAIMGGLGADYIDISEKEARSLVFEFYQINIKRNIPMPEPRNEYDFLIKDPIILDSVEKVNLMRKMCTPILSQYHLINYYVMRLYANDVEAAEFLSDGKHIIRYESAKPCTLLKNTIEEFFDERGRSYLCESLVEEGFKYRIIVSEIHVSEEEQGFVAKKAKVKSSFEVTPIEASLMLSRAEYITVYEIKECEEFAETFLEMKLNSLKNIHENGQVFIEFNVDNSHVNRRTFLLSDDIYGVYYLSDYGQLLVASYTEKNIRNIEKHLLQSELSKYMILNERLEFKESILYEFIESGYEDFYDFLLDI